MQEFFLYNCCGGGGRTQRCKSRLSPKPVLLSLLIVGAGLGWCTVARAHGAGNDLPIPEEPGWAVLGALDVSSTSASKSWPSGNWRGTLHTGTNQDDERSGVYLNRVEAAAGIRPLSWLGAGLSYSSHGSALRRHAELDSAKVVLGQPFLLQDESHSVLLHAGRFSPHLGGVFSKAGNFDDFQATPVMKRGSLGNNDAEDGLALSYETQAIPYFRKLSVAAHRSRNFPSSERSYSNKKLSPSLAIEFMEPELESWGLQFFARRDHASDRGMVLTQSVSIERENGERVSGGASVSQINDVRIRPLHEETPSDSGTTTDPSNSPSYGCNPVGVKMLCFNGSSTLIGVSGSWDLPWHSLLLSGALMQKLEQGTAANANSLVAVKSKTQGGWLELSAPLQGSLRKMNAALRLEHMRMKHQLSGAGSYALAQQADLIAPQSVQAATLALGYQFDHAWKLLLEGGVSQSKAGTNKHIQIRLVWKPDTLFQGRFLN